MQGIAFDFCRSTFMGFDQKPQRPAGQNLGRGVVERPAGNDLFRLLVVRQNLVFRPATATPAGNTSRGQGSGHPFEEMTPVDRPPAFGLDQPAGEQRKLMIQPSAKFRHVDLFVEASPVVRAGCHGRFVDLHYR